MFTAFFSARLYGASKTAFNGMCFSTLCTPSLWGLNSILVNTLYLSRNTNNHFLVRRQLPAWFLLLFSLWTAWSDDVSMVPCRKGLHGSPTSRVFSFSPRWCEQDLWTFLCPRTAVPEICYHNPFWLGWLVHFKSNDRHQQKFKQVTQSWRMVDVENICFIVLEYKTGTRASTIFLLKFSNLVKNNTFRNKKLKRSWSLIFLFCSKRERFRFWIKISPPHFAFLMSFTIYLVPVAYLWYLSHQT